MNTSPTHTVNRTSPRGRDRRPKRDLRVPAFLSPSKRLALTLGIAVLGAATGRAQSSSATWTSPAGGSWVNATNWSAGLYADGSGNSASFTNLNLSADVAVTLDGART